MNGFALINAIVTLRLYTKSSVMSGQCKQLPTDRHTIVNPRQELLLYVPPKDVYTSPSRHSKSVKPRFIRTVPGYYKRIGVLDYRWAV